MATSTVTSEMIRIYHAVRAGAGRELADRMFPHVARHLARLDSGVRNTGQLDDDER